MSRPSPLRVLIWKEWRQQRWVFVVAALLPISVTLMLRCFFEAACAVDFGVLALCLSALMLGANAFANEEQDRSAEFQRAMPVRIGSIYWIKAGTCCVLAACAVVINASVLLALPSSFRANSILSFAGETRQQQPLAFLLGMLALALAPALVASVARRTLLTVLLSVVLVVSVLLLVGLPISLLEICPTPFDGDWGQVIYVSTAIALTVAGGQLLWGRRARGTSLRSRVAFGGGFAAFVLALGLLPALASYAFLFFFAQLPYLSRQAPMTVLSPPAGGKWCAMWAGSWTVSRLFLFEPASGRCVMANRLRGTRWHGEEAWSPSGERCLLVGTDRWVWTATWFQIVDRTRNRTSDEIARTTYVLEPGTGRRTDIAAILPEVDAGPTPERNELLFCGWADEDTLAFWDGRDMAFVNIESRTVRRCVWPAPRPAGRPCYAVTHAGEAFLALAPGDGATPRKLLRFAARRAEAEVVDILRIEGWPTLRGASRDGRWVVVESGSQWQVVPVGSQGKAIAFRPGDASWRVRCRFRETPPELVSLSEGRVTVVNLRDMSQRTIELQPAGSNEMRLSPGGRYVQYVTHSRGSHDDRTPYRILDLDTGEHRDMPASGLEFPVGWISDDSVMVHSWVTRPKVVRWDGADKRPLFGR